MPETLSGPGLREEGSQVKRYGRAVGIWSGGRRPLTGEAALEGMEETSDMGISD